MALVRMPGGHTRAPIDDVVIGELRPLTFIVRDEHWQPHSTHRSRTEAEAQRDAHHRATGRPWFVDERAHEFDAHDPMTERRAMQQRPVRGRRQGDRHA